MHEFLLVWAVAATALGLSVAGLTLIYRLLGSDLGTDGWLRELGIVLFTSAIQAGLYMAVTALSNEPGRAAGQALYAFGVLATALAYKVTHLADMEALEICLLVLVNIAVLLLLRMAVLSILS